MKIVLNSPDMSIDGKFQCTINKAEVHIRKDRPYFILRTPGLNIPTGDQIRTLSLEPRGSNTVYEITYAKNVTTEVDGTENVVTVHGGPLD